MRFLNAGWPPRARRGRSRGARTSAIRPRWPAATSGRTSARANGSACPSWWRPTVQFSSNFFRGGAGLDQDGRYLRGTSGATPWSTCRWFLLRCSTNPTFLNLVEELKIDYIVTTFLIQTSRIFGTRPIRPASQGREVQGIWRWREGGAWIWFNCSLRSDGQLQGLTGVQTITGPASCSAAAALALLYTNGGLQLLTLILQASSEALDEVVGERIEDLHDFGALLGRALLVVDLVLGRELPAGLLPLVRDVQLVAHHKDAALGDALLERLVDVVVAALEGGHVREVEDAHAGLRALVVRAGEGSELLLPGSVPDLQGILLLGHLRGVGLEVDAHCGKVGSVEFGLAEPEEDAALAHGLRTHHYHLECPHFYILVRVVHLNIIAQPQPAPRRRCPCDPQKRPFAEIMIISHIYKLRREMVFCGEY